MKRVCCAVLAALLLCLSGCGVQSEPEQLSLFAMDTYMTLAAYGDKASEALAAIDKIHAKGKKAGVVVKPRTPASAVLPFIDRVEMILVMTVEPGFGGQRFMADMMPKVQEIRRYIDAMNPGCELEVDGGVDPATCKICVASGANVLVAGSAVYKAADIPARIRELRG